MIGQLLAPLATPVVILALLSVFWTTNGVGEWLADWRQASAVQRAERQAVNAVVRDVVEPLHDQVAALQSERQAARQQAERSRARVLEMQQRLAALQDERERVDEALEAVADQAQGDGPESTRSDSVPANGGGGLSLSADEWLRLFPD